MSTSLSRDEQSILCDRAKATCSLPGAIGQKCSWLQDSEYQIGPQIEVLEFNRSTSLIADVNIILNKVVSIILF